MFYALAGLRRDGNKDIKIPLCRPSKRLPERERALVKPSTIIALGATAARSLTGKTVTIAKMRRTPVELADGTKLVVTIHPSALLRIEDENDKRAAYRDFVTDLKAARAANGKAPAKR
jgi:DNA polymerase